MKWWKRLLATGLCFLLPTCSIAAQTEPPVWMSETESGENTEELIWEDTAVWETVTSELNTAPDVGGKGAILMALDSGEILFEKNAHDPLPIASVTKIMTLLLVMEAIDSGKLTYSDTLTCSETAAGMGGSQIWLEPGETMTVNDLLKAVTVVSANDACAVFAEHLNGSIEGFVARMNQRAAELGMTHTKFLDCSGLNDEAYSCAHDVALMSRALMQHEDIVRYTTIWMDTLRNGASQLVNTNKLVRHYEGATGLKTGTTGAAGHNLAATATRDGLSLVAVILGCKTTDERFGGARKLLDYGFANYTVYRPTLSADQLKPVPVTKGVTTQVLPATPKLPSILLKRGEEDQLVCEILPEASVAAPVERGQTIGTVAVKQKGKTIATYPLRAAGDVPALTYGIILLRLLTCLTAPH